MKPNMSGTDRTLRILVAIAAVVLYFSSILTGIWGIIALVVAGIFLLTSIVSFCPLYALFGLSTCPVQK